MKLERPWQVWLLFLGATILVSLIVGLVIKIITGSFSFLEGWTTWKLAVSVSLINMILAWSVTIYLGWTPVPEKWEFIVEFLGAYLVTWKPGLHIRFPYWGFMTIRETVYMGEQLMPLYMDERIQTGYGFGAVEFTNASTPVTAFVYFVITNSHKAVYNITNVLRALEEKLDGYVRNYLGNYSIDEAITLKTHFNLGRIMNNVLPDDKGQMRVVEPKDAPLWVEMRDNWGVEIRAIIISDLDLPPGLVEIRQKIIFAEKELDAAGIEKKTKIVRAEGDKEAFALQGEGLMRQIKDLTEKAKLPPVEAAAYLQKRLQWERLGEKAVIIETGTGSIAGLGAQFAAGMGIVAPKPTQSAESSTETTQPGSAASAATTQTDPSSSRPKTSNRKKKRERRN